MTTMIGQNEIMIKMNITVTIRTMMKTKPMNSYIPCHTKDAHNKDDDPEETSNDDASLSDACKKLQ